MHKYQPVSSHGEPNNIIFYECPGRAVFENIPVGVPSFLCKHSHYSLKLHIILYKHQPVSSHGEPTYVVFYECWKSRKKCFWESLPIGFPPFLCKHVFALVPPYTPSSEARRISTTNNVLNSTQSEFWDQNVSIHHINVTYYSVYKSSIYWKRQWEILGRGQTTHPTCPGGKYPVRGNPSLRLEKNMLATLLTRWAQAGYPAIPDTEDIGPQKRGSTLSWLVDPAPHAQMPFLLSRSPIYRELYITSLPTTRE